MLTKTTKSLSTWAGCARWGPSHHGKLDVNQIGKGQKAERTLDSNVLPQLINWHGVWGGGGGGDASGELRLREAAAVERPPAPSERRGGGLSPASALPPFPSRPASPPGALGCRTPPRGGRSPASSPAAPGPPRPSRLPARRPGKEPGPACAPGSPAPTEEVTWTHYYPVWIIPSSFVEAGREGRGREGGKKPARSSCGGVVLLPGLPGTAGAAAADRDLLPSLVSRWLLRSSPAPLPLDIPAPQPAAFPAAYRVPLSRRGRGSCCLRYWHRFCILKISSGLPLVLLLFFFFF